MMYLGTLGRMVPIKCPTAQRVNLTDRYSFTATLGGRVKAQAGPPGKRSWDISTGQLTTPADVGTLMEFATGVWGPGPFAFIPADAPVVNMLTPAAASCDRSVLNTLSGAEIIDTPPMNLGDEGVAARSVWSNGVGTVRFGDTVPVKPGKPVTASAWVLGAGSIRLTFVNASGNEIRAGLSPEGSPGAPQRLSVTLAAHPQAVGARISTTAGVTQVARPAITWTDQPFEWGDGQGCPQAVVHSPSRDVVKAWDNPTTGRWSNLSFVVQEIG